MITLFNLIWFILIGWWSALAFLILGILFSLTIIGIPIGKSLIQFSKLNAFPYGKEIIRETELKGKSNISEIRKLGGIILNLIWFPIGLFLTVTYIFAAIAAFLSIIGIPVGIVYFKMGEFLLFPIGAKVVSKEEARAYFNRK